MVTNLPSSGYEHSPGANVPSGQVSLYESQRLSFTTLESTLAVVFTGGSLPESPVQLLHELPINTEDIEPIKDALGVHELQSLIAIQHEPELSTNPVWPATSEGLDVLLIHAIKLFWQFCIQTVPTLWTTYPSNK
jgi:hypothetical protein